MNVGVVTTSYPRAPGDPAGSFVAAHVAALRALGHTVDVIAAGTSTDDDRVTRVSSGLFDRGGVPDHLEHHPVRSLAAAAVFSARLTAAVARRARRWDTIIAHWLVPSALAALPSRAPLLAIAHGGDVHTLRRMRLLAPVLHVLHARRAMLAFVSEPLRALAHAAAPRLSAWLDQATIQPMGLDLERFAAIDHAPTHPPTILVVGRLVNIKGIDVAIDASSYLRAPARIVIAGDGPDRAQLEARARARLAARADAGSGSDRPYRRGTCSIEFLGAVAPDHRDRLLGQASVVVVPSRVTSAGRTEGMPLIALEALAAGVPVVASAVGGLTALGLARLVPPDRPAELAAAIDEILSSPPDATELRAAVAHLDWRSVAPRLVRNA